VTERPNVLLVVFDTARADALEPYGAPSGASPAVAQLARRGAALAHVYATASWTLPSHASMFTGRYARELGLGQAPGSNPHAARPLLEAQEPRLLPAVLRRAGYATLGVSTNVWVSRVCGFDTGFDAFEEVVSVRQMTLTQKDRRALVSSAREALRAEVDDGAAAAGGVLERWIETWSGTPTFWFVNLVECHSPYLPPRPYNDLGPVARLRALREARRYLTLDAIWRSCIGPFDVPDGALERMRHLYASAVRYLDDWLANVLEALDRRGILDDTLVIVTSDHGENFGEGGLLAHAYSLDDRLIHVPFVAAGAGVEADDGVYSLADVPRMVADVTGIADGAWEERDGAGDIAVAQFDVPVHPAGPHVTERVLTEWGLEDDDDARARATLDQTAATDGRHKLLIRGTREELYDLRDDPLELAPLPEEDLASRPVRDRLRAALSDPTLRDRPLAVPAAPTPDVDAAEAARIEQQMRLLGYL
jgi:arylsulfatase A-like enzyme